MKNERMAARLQDTAADLATEHGAAAPIVGKTLRAALRMNPRCPIARKNLAEHELACGRSKRALQHACSAVRLNPHEPEACYTLARALLANDRRFAAMRPLAVFLAAVDVGDAHDDETIVRIVAASTMLAKLRREAVIEGTDAR